MRFTRLVAWVFFVVVVSLISTPSFAEEQEDHKGEREPAQSKELDRGFEEIYSSVLRHLFYAERLPEGMTPIGFTELVAVRFLPIATETGKKEYWVHLFVAPEKKALAIVVEPEATTIRHQLKKLWKEHPAYTTDQFAKLITVRRWKIFHKDVPELIVLVEKVWEIEISPLIPVTLMRNGWKYKFRTVSFWGGSFETKEMGWIEYAVSGPNPLLDWADELRQTIRKYNKDQLSNR